MCLQTGLSDSPHWTQFPCSTFGGILPCNGFASNRKNVIKYIFHCVHQTGIIPSGILIVVEERICNISPKTVLMLGRYPTQSNGFCLMYFAT